MTTVIFPFPRLHQHVASPDAPSIEGALVQHLIEQYPILIEPHEVRRAFLEQFLIRIPHETLGQWHEFQSQIDRLDEYALFFKGEIDRLLRLQGVPEYTSNAMQFLRMLDGAVLVHLDREYAY